jgi:hypothetical protein
MNTDLINDLKNNYWEKGVDFFCKKYHKTRSAIHSMAHKHKCTAIHHFEANKENILQDYKNGVSFQSILLKYGHGEKTLHNFLIKNKVKIRGLRESHLKYSINESIFKIIDSHEKAYWLGFLYADGNIYKNKLQLRLGKKDFEHLKSFKNFLESNHTIYQDKNCYGIQIRCPKIVSDLLSLGIKPNKTQLVEYPTEKQVPKEYISSFILGYFDGDGSISIRSNNSTYVINIIGTQHLLKGIQKVLLEFCPNLVINLKPESRNKKAWILHFSGGVKKYAKSRDRFLCLYSFLFTNAPKCVLMRKYLKFKTIYNYAKQLA